MNQIDNITDAPKQETRAVLNDGSILTLTLAYRPATQRWTFDLSHPTLTVFGLNLCVHPNLLREWRNVIPFGLVCLTTFGADPFNVNDFTMNRAAIFVLDSADVQNVEENVFQATA